MLEAITDFLFGGVTLLLIGFFVFSICVALEDTFRGVHFGIGILRVFKFILVILLILSVGRFVKSYWGIE